MYSCGYAQEIITPPIGVDLAGYFNHRYNIGMYDDLYVKVVMFQANGKTFGFMTFDLCYMKAFMHKDLDKHIQDQFGKDIWEGLIVSCTHSHTASFFPEDLDAQNEATKYAYQQTIDAAMRALKRALMNLQPCDISAGSVYNNPYGFVRRYYMKNGDVVTNPGWCNPDIDKPETNYDRTIGIMAVKQGGRLVALICNIANHGDTIGGSIVSADWYGRFTQAIQYQLKTSLPVLVVDDASGNINHFDFNQKINQTSYAEATRIGRGYASIVLDALDSLEPITEEDIKISNGTVKVPHRKLTEAEVAEAQHLVDTIPDTPREGDLESQDLAKKDPYVLRYFALRALACHKESTPYSEGRLTVIQLGKQMAFATLPGEPFNGIGAAIRAKSPCKYTFVIELSQCEGDYIPMKDCFPRGGYEVMPRINSSAPEASDVLIEGSCALFH